MGLVLGPLFLLCPENYSILVLEQPTEYRVQRTHSDLTVNRDLGSIILHEGTIPSVTLQQGLATFEWAVNTSEKDVTL